MKKNDSITLIEDPSRRPTTEMLRLLLFPAVVAAMTCRSTMSLWSSRAMTPAMTHVLRVANPHKCMAEQTEPTYSILEQDADAVFNVVDIDGDGSVTKDELIAHLTSCGYQQGAVDKIFEKLDTDGSGCLSREELRAGTNG